VKAEMMAKKKKVKFANKHVCLVFIFNPFFITKKSSLFLVRGRKTIVLSTYADRSSLTRSTLCRVSYVSCEQGKILVLIENVCSGSENARVDKIKIFFKK
jgi:hypothetical protein